MKFSYLAVTLSIPLVLIACGDDEGRVEGGITIDRGVPAAEDAGLDAEDPLVADLGPDAEQPLCGNGAVDEGELCDVAITGGEGACPTECDDGIACTNDVLDGEGCTAQCLVAPINACDGNGGDRCCPSGCDNNTDDDCSPTCGNGAVEEGEICDTAIPAGSAGACVSDCNDSNACTADQLVGGGCSVSCSNPPINSCGPAEGCCPPGCNANTDPDCSPTCGNGAVEQGETCDTAITSGQGACPASCDDGQACTNNQIVGSGCGVSCTFPQITQCKAASDGCCPSGCNANNDPDCSPTCGNGAVEQGETCDTAIVSGAQGACPTSCNDGQSCTLNQLVGSGCGASCSFPPITQCSQTADNCCPNGCNANNDADCSPTCGNGVVEQGESCDTSIGAGAAGACPTSCNDGQACTLNQLVGSGCSASCSFPQITQCSNSSDGCCPSGCNANNDADCSPTCGNGTVEQGETCDTAITSGAGVCPTSCNDGVACTLNQVVGSGCGVSCSFPQITQCANVSDGCCPSGCNANNDADCSPTCGNGIVEQGETCDTAIVNAAGQCPTACGDGNNCTIDQFVGSQCTLACSYTPITQCEPQIQDGCCPAGCNANTDTDCPSVCGNGVWEWNEECDTAIPAGVAGHCPTSCNDGAVCTDDQLSGQGCQTKCTHTPITQCDGQFNTDGCCPAGCTPNSDADCNNQPICGNGVRESGEQCDEKDIPANAVCPADGVVTCTTSCKLDTTGCYKCGNGQAELAEQCDGNDFKGKTCLSYGFLFGQLVCSVNCQQVRTTQCFNPFP